MSTGSRKPSAGTQGGGERTARYALNSGADAFVASYHTTKAKQSEKIKINDTQVRIGRAKYMYTYEYGL
jgi:hypothetical protein